MSEIDQINTVTEVPAGANEDLEPEDAAALEAEIAEQDAEGREEQGTSIESSVPI